MLRVCVGPTEELPAHTLSAVSAERGGTTRKKQRRSTASGARRVTLVPGVPATVADFIPYCAQESLVQSLISLYPEHFFTCFQFPMVEDLVSSPPFTCFGQWLHAQECLGLVSAFRAPLPTSVYGSAAEGRQAGAHSGRAALPPLLLFGLSMDEHFAAALRCKHGKQAPAIPGARRLPHAKLSAKLMGLAHGQYASGQSSPRPSQESSDRANCLSSGDKRAAAMCFAGLKRECNTNLLASELSGD